MGKAEDLRELRMAMRTKGLVAGYGNSGSGLERLAREMEDQVGEGNGVEYLVWIASQAPSKSLCVSKKEGT